MAFIINSTPDRGNIFRNKNYYLQIYHSTIFLRLPRVLSI